MNALRIVLIVAALAIFGCAGVERKCVMEAVSENQQKIEKLEKRHTEPRVTDSCKMVSIEGNRATFHCDVADPIDDEDYAHLLDMYMWSLRMDIERCL